MPAKPAWFQHVDRLIAELKAHPRAFVDRAMVEHLLGVGRRRAQQIMAPCVTERVGASGLADRDLLIAHIRRLAEGEEAFYERRRRHKVAVLIERLRTDLVENPRVLVEAPLQIVNQELDGLPAGVEVSPGRITVKFGRPAEALEKLLALAMAIGNDFERFERRAALSGE